MFNECGMTSRQSFSSRLYAVSEEGSAEAASAGSALGGRFGKALLGSDVPAWDRHPGTPRICLHVFSPQMPLVPFWAKPQGAAAAVGRAGRGEAGLRAWPRAGAHSHALPLHSELSRGTGKVSAWSRTSQSLPRRGLWNRGVKPELDGGQPGRMGVSGCESLHSAPVKMLFYSHRKGVSNIEIWMHVPKRSPCHAGDANCPRSKPVPTTSEVRAA